MRAFMKAAQLRIRLSVTVWLALFAPLSTSAQSPSLTEWLKSEAEISWTRMNENISPLGAARGVILASPSRQDPDYYFHWIRDSALVVDALSLFAAERAGEYSWRQTFVDYVAFSRQLQSTQTLTGLGEPRFNVDGTAFNGNSARPQNDGPPLPVLPLLRGAGRL